MVALLVDCFRGCSAGVTGDGKASLATLTAVEPLFSCELEGSTASLLGTGVIVTVRLTLAMELDFEVSVRQETTESLWDGVLDEEDGSCCDDGVAPEDEFGVVPAALEKKPRMLCCLPVEEPACLGAGRAGVRAEDAALPAIWNYTIPVLAFQNSRGLRHQTHQVDTRRQKLGGGEKQ